MNEETEKRGSVAVFVKIKDIEFKNCDKALGGCMFLHRIVSDLPFRYEAYHKCLEPTYHQGLVTRLMHNVVDAVVAVMSPGVVTRTKIHYGTHNVWMNELMTFGIPTDLIPLTASYKIKNKNHLEYLSMRQLSEKMRSVNQTKTTFSTELPTNRDVLLGKGRPIQFFSGNRRLALLIDDYLDQYHNKSSKAEKTALAAAIVQKVKNEKKARFLSKESGIWMEVSDTLAREKVKHMLRHQRQKTKSENSVSATTNSNGHKNDDGDQQTSSSSTRPVTPSDDDSPDMKVDNKRVKV